MRERENGREEQKQLAKESYNYCNLVCSIERTETNGGNKVLRLFKQWELDLLIDYDCVSMNRIYAWLCHTPMYRDKEKLYMYICRWCEIMVKLVRNRNPLLIDIAQIIMIWLYSQRVSIIRYIRYCLWSVKSWIWRITSSLTSSLFTFRKIMLNQANRNLNYYYRNVWKKKDCIFSAFVAVKALL